MVYDVGNESSEDDEIFSYFNPKKKDKKLATGITNKSGRTTKKSILTKISKGSKGKKSLKIQDHPDGEYYTENDIKPLKKGKSHVTLDPSL